MDQAPLELRDFLAILWRHKWTIAAVSIAAVAAALFYSFRTTPLYTSSAEVVVRPARFDLTQPRAATATGIINMVTEERVANSVPVARRAEEKLKVSGAEIGAVTATLVPDSETLDFTAVSPDPAGAQAAAQAWAKAYLELRRELVLSDLAAARLPLEQQIASIDERLVSIAGELAETQDPAEQAMLEAENATLLQTRSSAEQRLNLLPSAGNIQVGEVLQPAPLPSGPSSPNHLAAVGLAAAVGLSLGVGMAYVWDRLDSRIRGREELEAHSGAPVLALIPPGSPLEGDLPVTAADPGSELAEAYQALSLRISRVGEGQGGTAVIVTSSLAGEGKTSVVANLGVALAQLGRRVVLVSADLRRPALEQFFPDSQGAGLTEVLYGQRRATQVLMKTPTENLLVLHAGPLLPSTNALELLSSDHMRYTLEELRRLADFVLIDTPPLLGALDGMAVARFADGVLYVADARMASKATVDQARRDLELSGTTTIGVVVNRYDSRNFRPYDHRYTYTADGYRHQIPAGLTAERLDRGEAKPGV
jgi:capsular exopolysaccharide synthesis family protein